MIEIKNSRRLIEAAETEFWIMFPDIYAKWCHFLGNVIDAVEKDVISEEEYVRTWYNKLPPTKENQS